MLPQWVLYSVTLPKRIFFQSSVNTGLRFHRSTVTRLPPWRSQLYCDDIIFPFLCHFPLSGSEQAEWDPGCCQGYWHKDGGRVGGLHGWDWHSCLLQPPSHCQTVGCLLLWRQTLGKRRRLRAKRFFVLFFSLHPYWSEARAEDTDAVKR